MPDDAPLSDAERELANRRRDLEREFDDKQRDLKAQHKRQADKLQSDREEWEAYKREQQKALADQAERIHRKVDNTVKADESKAALEAEVKALKARVQELEELRLKDKVARDHLGTRAGRAESRLKSYGPLLLAFSALTLFGTAAWTVVALQSAPSTLPWALPSLAVALLLNVWRLRIVRRR